MNRALGAFSAALGVAYQIRDDLHDGHGGEGASDIEAGRLSVLRAIAWEETKNHREAPSETATHAIAQGLLEEYACAARGAVQSLNAPALRLFLEEVMTVILADGAPLPKRDET